MGQVAEREAGNVVRLRIPDAPRKAARPGVRSEAGGTVLVFTGVRYDRPGPLPARRHEEASRV